MGTITLTLPTALSQITAGLHATNYAALQALLNGNLDNTNISPTAALAISKLAGYPADGAKVLKGDGTWGAAGAITLLDDYTVSGAALASYDTNTRLGGNIPATYKHLMLKFKGNGDSGGATWVNLRINNSSAASYYTQYLTASGAGAANAEQIGATSSQIFQIAGGAGFGAHAELDFEHYLDASWSPQIISKWGVSANNSTGNFRTGQNSAWFAALGAVTRFSLTPASGNFVIGSRFSLYGIN